MYRCQYSSKQILGSFLFLLVIVASLYNQALNMNLVMKEAYALAGTSTTTTTTTPLVTTTIVSSTTTTSGVVVFKIMQNVVWVKVTVKIVIIIVVTI